MKKIALVTMFLLSGAASATADCVISPDARGSTSEGTLCRFEDEEEVLPEYAAERRGSYSDYLFSPQEELKMLKNIVIKNRSGGNDGLLRSAVQGATTPRKTIGGTKIVIAK